MSSLSAGDNLSRIRESVASAPKRCAGNGYCSMKTHLTGDQLAALAELEVRNTAGADFYGRAPEVSVWIKRQLEMRGNSGHQEAVKAAASLVHQLADASLSLVKGDAVWVAIRAFLPGDVKQYRWRQDGNFFPSQEQEFKVVVTLKGQATLLAPAPKNISAVMALQQQLADLSLEPLDPRIHVIQNEINQHFDPASTFSERNPGHATIFRVGRNAAFYSEPLTTEPCWFVSIVPGKIADVIKLKETTAG